MNFLSRKKGSGSGDRSSGGSQNRRKVFGEKIDKKGTRLPIVLIKAVDYFASKGVETEGLFRLNGNLELVKSIKDRLDAGEDVDFMEISDTHTVAHLLKLWFRELPEPLLTFELYDCFLAAASVPVEEASIQATKKALKLLPPLYYATLKYLAAFLNRVQQESDVNKMTSSNLAVVFAPNLLRPPPSTSTDTTTLLKDSAYQTKLMQLLIVQYEAIFEDASAIPAQGQALTPSLSWRTSRPPGTIKPVNS